VGSRLLSFLNPESYDVTVLSRSEHRDTKIKYAQWDTQTRKLDPQVVEGAYAIINLAGAGIADARWTDERKRIIIESRVQAAETLGIAVAASNSRPKLYLGASAVGYYGDRGNEKLDEESAKGSGFLSDVCQKWEEASMAMATCVDHSAVLRIGIVLSTQGGALKEILKSTKTGVYGYFGNGKAYYPWIHIDDLCRMFAWCLDHKVVHKVYNATGIDPVPVKELVSAVRKAKSGWGPLVPVPEIALSLVLGEMRRMLLDSARVYPRRFRDAGFSYEYTNPVNAIKDLLEREI